MKFKKRNKYLISNKLANSHSIFDLSKQKTFKDKSTSTQIKFHNSNRYINTSQKSNQIILIIGNKTCPLSSFEYLPLKVLESHLSFGMSSLLFKLFREKNGLTYDVGVFNPFRKQNSPFLIYLSVSNENALLAFKILCDLWKKLLHSLINENEINFAKVKLKSSFLMGNQTLDEILQRRIKLIGFDLDPDFDMDCLRKIEDINSEDILKITNKYLAKPYLSVYGDKKICGEIYKIWIENF